MFNKMYEVLVSVVESIIAFLFPSAAEQEVVATTYAIIVDELKVQLSKTAAVRNDFIDYVSGTRFAPVLSYLGDNWFGNSVTALGGHIKRSCETLSMSLNLAGYSAAYGAFRMLYVGIAVAPGAAWRSVTRCSKAVYTKATDIRDDKLVQFIVGGTKLGGALIARGMEMLTFQGGLRTTGLLVVFFAVMQLLYAATLSPIGVLLMAGFTHAIAGVMLMGAGALVELVTFGVATWHQKRLFAAIRRTATETFESDPITVEPAAPVQVVRPQVYYPKSAIIAVPQLSARTAS